MTKTTTGRQIETDLRRGLAAMQLVMAELDPAAVPLSDASALFQLFTQVRKLAGNGATMLAGRVTEARDWARAGYPSPEEWIAAQTGSTVGAAKGQVKTSNRLGGLGATAERMRSGDLSPEQAELVVDGASVNPDAEQDLLDTAERESNKTLRAEAERRKAQARRESDEARAERHHRERSARAWTDRDGKAVFKVEGSVGSMAGFLAAWNREIDRRYRTARRTGLREGRDAYGYDAFQALTSGSVEGEPKKPNPKHLALIRVDLTALVRGEVAGTEVCEVPGVGTLTVTEARELLGESILHLVCTKGVDVQNVTSLSRAPNAAQTIALLWSDQMCRVEGCHRTHVEYDHRIEHRVTGHTRLDETDPKCDHHHDLTTYKGWALVAGTGRRPLVPPDDPRHPNNTGASAAAPETKAAPEARPLESPDQGARVSRALLERFARAHDAARRPTPPQGRQNTGQGDLFDTG